MYGWEQPGQIVEDSLLREVYGVEGVEFFGNSSHRGHQVSGEGEDGGDVGVVLDSGDWCG